MAVVFGVLGPLVAEGGRGPVDLKGPRHRAVLARLLVAKGRVVPVSWLVDDLWEDPPVGAVGAIQSFVFTLRRALEPDRPPRTPSGLLVTAAPGYALHAGDAVDAVRFEAAVESARDLLAAGDAGSALSVLDDALALWRGPAYSEFAEEAWARGEVARLDELRLLAVERRAEAVLALGRPAEAAAGLEAHVAGRPWREDAWRLLALALYRSGRQADALGALRRAKRALADELGVDPGPELRRLEADILGHAPHLSGEPVRAPVPQVGFDHPFVGRAAEVARLEDAAADVLARGRLGLVLAAGDAGAGKTALTEVVARRLADRGWTTLWNRNQEHDGGRLLPDAVAPPGDPATRRHRAVVDHLSTVDGPVLLVVDDLHWAGDETLTLLASLVAERLAARVLVVGTYRTTEISAGLGEALARFARAEPTRIHLGGLDGPAVAELVRATAYRDVDDATARVVHRRSGGNPFFVRELARLLDDEGAQVLSAVPEGVRDVIRRRVAHLPEPARQVLRRAAVIGREVDLDQLITLCGDEGAVLDAVESAQLMGFVTERGPDEVRFAHDLVRDTLYADIPRSRRARWHAGVAEAVERVRPDDVDTLAHHFLRAESRATAARAAYYARAAAERAEQRFAPHEAARLWRDAIAAHDRSGSDDVRTRLRSTMGMVRALAVTGDLAAARRHRAEALTAAGELGDPELTAAVIGSYDVPAIWTGNDDQAMSDHLVEVAERTLAALDPGNLAARCRLLGTLALELRGTTGGRGREAACEAEAIARRLDDPALLAFALNGRFMQSFERAGLAPRRAAIGHELLAVAGRHRLVSFEVLAHLILIQAHAALGEFAVADGHAATVDRIAERHELPLVGVFTEWYAALRLAVTGRDDEARAAYRTAGARLGGTGMAGLEAGILPFALLCVDVRAGRTPEEGDWGPYRPWADALRLLADGRREEARAAVRDSPRDLLYEARTCLTAIVAIGVDDHALMRQAYDGLLPAAGELAGAGSGLLTLGPVASYLADLAVALGLPQDAELHRRQARELTDKCARRLCPHEIARAWRAPAIRSGRMSGQAGV
ncbi:DNA-binding SARP family transcriptional activator [Saccharothrix tamanrassetensis]|uniref:DNA-binding SARP family transcriptional activator n=1 Tax=Saccharothrix tamanrassetensis TaxID=1051531 RepID=A0A841CXL6_9PSEU|nr:BTAD domain-containing putative transcriptional regulator [Saccharothrix tamanrassetensis]MBB5960096.1 DNA-binding SARP family transcriptional activator [Saccharothrix tamanrassetensis]